MKDHSSSNAATSSGSPASHSSAPAADALARTTAGTSITGPVQSNGSAPARRVRAADVVVDPMRLAPCRAMVRCSRTGGMSDLATSEEEQPPAIALPASSRSTAQFGVIVFLASDVMLFGPFFAAYFLLRANNPPWPPEYVDL